MKNKNLNTSQPDHDNFFRDGKFNWEKSREKVWDELASKMTTGAHPRTIRVNFTRLSIAAGFLLLIGLTTFLRFHSVTYTTGSLVQRTIGLSDGSTVELNANSTLVTYPYWWKIHRVLNLEGEAFFQVEKGNRFTVHSGPGKIEVLGTSFNVFSLNNVLKVTCLTGEVRVVSAATEKEKVVIKPNTVAEVKNKGSISVKKESDTYQETAWRSGSFYFTADPVQDVFARFEQQYGITIQAELDTTLTYTGNFRIEKNVETVLGYVCPALGLTYIKEATGKYLIVKDEE